MSQILRRVSSRQFEVHLPTLARCTSPLLTPTSIPDEIHNEEAAPQAVGRLQSLGGQMQKDEAAKIRGQRPQTDDGI